MMRLDELAGVMGRSGIRARGDASCAVAVVPSSTHGGGLVLPIR